MGVSYGGERMIGNLPFSLLNGQKAKQRREKKKGKKRGGKKKKNEESSLFS